MVRPKACVHLRQAQPGGSPASLDSAFLRSRLVIPHCLMSHFMLQRHSYHINYTQNIKLSSAEGLFWISFLTVFPSIRHLALWNPAFDLWSWARPQPIQTSACFVQQIPLGTSSILNTDCSCQEPSLPGAHSTSGESHKDAMWCHVMYCIILYLPSHEPDVEAMGK